MYATKGSVTLARLLVLLFFTFDVVESTIHCKHPDVTFAENFETGRGAGVHYTGKWSTISGPAITFTQIVTIPVLCSLTS